jgi:hypothetical protein
LAKAKKHILELNRGGITEWMNKPETIEEKQKTK